MSYQWRKGADSLPRQTNASLTLANVTAANAGDYSVAVTNALGGVRSTNAMLNILSVREELIAEVNFQDKQPERTSAWAYSSDPVPLKTNLVEMAGAGVGGATALIMRADGSGFTNNMNQDFTGFGFAVGVNAGRTNGINTTDLSLYRVYATIRTAGLTGKSAAGHLEWDFMATHRSVQGLSVPITLTTNFQVYSFVLSDGLVADYNSDSWNQFTNEFDQINGLQLIVGAADWLSQYGANPSSALYISNVKFVRLLPAISAQPNRAP